MYQEATPKDWKARFKENKLIILGLSAIVIILIVIGVVLAGQLPSGSQFTNKMTGKLSVLKDSDLKHVQEILNKYLKDIYGYSNSEANRVKKTIREDSVDITDLDGLNYVTFLVDLDHPKVTYQVALVAGEGIDEVTVMCPKYEEMQDKTVFCVGYDGDSTLDVIFGDYLPYQNIPDDPGDTDAPNEKVPGYEDMLIMIRQVIEEDGVPVLSANVGACEDGADGEAARNFINNWIREKGNNIDPKLIPLRIKYVDCSMGLISE